MSQLAHEKAASLARGGCAAAMLGSHGAVGSGAVEQNDLICVLSVASRCRQRRYFAQGCVQESSGSEVLRSRRMSARSQSFAHGVLRA